MARFSNLEKTTFRAENEICIFMFIRRMLTNRTVPTRPARWTQLRCLLVITKASHLHAADFISPENKSDQSEKRFRLIKVSFVFAGSSIERLCDVAASDPTGYAQLDDRGPMVRAARALLGSVTRVLLLADIVVVKQLLLAKDRVRIRKNFDPSPEFILFFLSLADIEDIR